MAVTIPVGYLRKVILNNEVMTLDVSGAGAGGVNVSVAGGGAAISSGTLTLAGGNNITLSQVGQGITISGPNTVAQSVQTQNMVDLTLGGNTAGALALMSSGTVTIAGGNNITLSQVGNAFTISAANAVGQTVQTQNLFDLTLAGNTSGVLALVSSGTLSLAGGNGLTFSQAGGNAITAFVQTYLNQFLLMGG